MAKLNGPMVRTVDVREALQDMEVKNQQGSIPFLLIHPERDQAVNQMRMVIYLRIMKPEALMMIVGRMVMKMVYEMETLDRDKLLERFMKFKTTS